VSKNITTEKGGEKASVNEKDWVNCKTEKKSVRGERECWGKKRGGGSEKSPPYNHCEKQVLKGDLSKTTRKVERTE